LFTFYKNITLIKVAYFPFKYGKWGSTNTVSLHQSPRTTGARHEWGVHTHARAAWDLKNLLISIFRKESKLKRSIF